MAESSDKGLETLQVWQRALSFAVKVCKQIATRLPEEENWCLAIQLRRSVQSIPANIAEGYGRYHYLDEIRFCHIARGSLEETFSHLAFAEKMGYLPENTYLEVSAEVNDIRRLINGYIVFLKKKKRGSDEPASNRNIHDDFPTYFTENDINPDLTIP